ncbi:MAG: hypothetical protein K1X78_27920 [Verrucomicrobiaceae bacterium]|nr:hypothetical protein [Verrucomicrobiaceae bacterium]
MNIRLSLALIVAAASLASCVYQPPPRHPRRPGTGVNLDRPASGERSNRESRYLEEEVTQRPSTPAPSAPAPETPEPSDAAAQVQAPSGATPPPSTPTTAEADKPKEKEKETAPAPAPSAPELPYGKPVPGKKGFVYSPYDQSAGFVDVRDIGPGTKVRCPYTGKIFRVP